MLNLPNNSKDVIQRAKTDVQREAPGSNPFKKNSLIGAFTTSFANRVFDFYQQLLITIDAMLPDTAIGEFVERWAAIFGKQRLAASTSSGNVVAIGVNGSSIPANTNMASSDGVLYRSTVSAVISTQSLNIFSLIRNGSLVVVTTTPAHNLANNVPITITGAVEPGYDGTFAITIDTDDPTKFTYEITTTPSTPATGIITATGTYANLPVVSEDFQNTAEGVNVNQDTGAPLDLQSPLLGVDSTLVVDFGEIGGGTDQESDAELRDRYLDKIQNPVANFNPAAISEKAKEVAGVTRVFVKPVTPALGQVTVYFMRDNDSNPVPSESEIVTVKQKIVDDILPANTSIQNLIMGVTSGPLLDPGPALEASLVEFVFSSLEPNTPGMQAAVTSNLQQFFATIPEPGVLITEDEYRCAIQNTVDTETGQELNSFVLTTPIGPILTLTNEIAQLGNVTYP